ILTAREKKFRQKFNSEQEVEAWGKRLKDVEKKLRTLEKRDQHHQRSKSTPHVVKQAKDESSSISEEIPSKKSISTDSHSSLNRTVVRKQPFQVVDSNHDHSEIKTDTNISRHKSNDYDENFDTSIQTTTASAVIPQRKKEPIEIRKPTTVKQVSESEAESFSVIQSDMTSDVSDVEYRIKQLREQLKRKKYELDKLKKDQRRKNKEVLRKQEDELKKQIHSCDTEIQNLRQHVDSMPPIYPVVLTPTTETEKSLSSSIHSIVHGKLKSVELKTVTDKKSQSSSSSSSTTPTRPLSKSPERPIQQTQPRIIANGDARKMRILTPEQSIVEEIQQSISDDKSQQDKSQSKTRDNDYLIFQQKPILHEKKNDDHLVDDKDFFDDDDSISDKQQDKHVTQIQEKKVEQQKSIDLFSPRDDRTNHDAHSISTAERSNNSQVDTDHKTESNKLIKFNILEDEKQKSRSPSPTSLKVKPIDNILKKDVFKDDPWKSSSSSSSSSTNPPSRKKEPEDIKINQEKSIVPPPEKEKSISQIKPTTLPPLGRINSADLSTSDRTSVDYDEDFSDASRSAAVPDKVRQKSSSSSSTLPIPSKKLIEQPMKEDDADNIGIESIQEDLQFSKSQQSSSKTSKSSGEQSEILVLVKKSANNTPRLDPNASLTDHLLLKQHELVSENKLLKSDEKPVVIDEDERKKSPTDESDDTMYDVSEKPDEDGEQEQEDEQLDINENIDDFFLNQQIRTTPTPEDDQEQNQKQGKKISNEQKIDHVTDQFIRTFINEAIKESSVIKQKKLSKNISSVNVTTSSVITHLTKEASEWVSDDETSDDDENIDKKQQTKHENDEDLDAFIRTLSSQANFIDEININGANGVEQDDLKLDLSRLDEKGADEPRIESPRKPAVEEQIKPVVPHTLEDVNDICKRAMTILFQQNRDFSDPSKINKTIPDDYFQISEQVDEIERRSQHAYQSMIYDLCIEILTEMYMPNVRQAQYPWQKAQLIPKRYYRQLNPPRNMNDAQKFVNEKILEMLGLIPRKVQYSKWRNPKRRDQFETVLYDELRRQEPNWINYDQECVEIKLKIADMIFEQILQETLNGCIDVIKRHSSISGATAH
ncbi:unnamed protein product, partial [Didymodactylos carnosus]